MRIDTMNSTHSTHYSNIRGTPETGQYQPEVNYTTPNSSSSNSIGDAAKNSTTNNHYQQHATPFYDDISSSRPGRVSVTVRSCSGGQSRVSHVPYPTVISLRSDQDRDALFSSPEPEQPKQQHHHHHQSHPQKQSQSKKTPTKGAGLVNGRTYGVPTAKGTMDRSSNGHVNGTVEHTHKTKTDPPSPPPKPIHHSWPYHHNNAAPELYYVEDQTTKTVSKGVQSPVSSNTGSGQKSADQHPYFTSSRDLKKPETMREMRIVSTRGTVRGYKNRVRAGIASLLDTEKNKQLRTKEQGKIVLYTTSMTVVRDTYDHCSKVRRILQTHMVQFEERDIFMSKQNQTELMERLGIEDVEVPQVFADGNHLGDVTQIDSCNESGELKKIFAHFPKIVNSSSCDKCGGYRFVNCTTCHGSKKSLTRNSFSAEFCALRCVSCDENGLVKCDKCTD